VPDALSQQPSDRARLHGASRPAGRSAVIVGCARDCAHHLQAVLANIERESACFSETAFVFLENDSKDETLARLREFAAGRRDCHVEELTGLQARHPFRTDRLAVVRNRYLDIIRASALREFEYLIVYDMDEINASPRPAENFIAALDFLAAGADRAAVFANQVGHYYDVFALRHAELCPTDAWEDVFNYVLRHGVSDQIAFQETYAKRMYAFDPLADPIEVDSAFGGLGLYRMKFALQSSYEGLRRREIVVGDRPRRLLWQACEHVQFHEQIRRLGGRLFITPWLVNVNFGAIDRNRPPFSPSLYRRHYVFID
jgi:hypothetical protein